jgi:hypothetical protein
VVVGGEFFVWGCLKSVDAARNATMVSTHVYVSSTSVVVVQDVTDDRRHANELLYAAPAGLSQEAKVETEKHDRYAHAPLLYTRHIEYFVETLHLSFLIFNSFSFPSLFRS